MASSPKAEANISPWRSFLHRFVPANFTDMFGLTRRLLFEGKKAGRMAMLYSAAGLVLTPLDLLLLPFEKRRLRNAKPSVLPLIFIGGPPRSGTTLVGQVLMKHLRVHYFNNLTSLFPRSTITASRVFGSLARIDRKKLKFQSFYGRTSRLSSPNDALYLWDRWMGSDRSIIPEKLSEEAKDKMRRFFGAVETSSGVPLVNKNNSLNTTAGLVAEALPNAFFIILDRDPLYLAQSHYVARRFIHGHESIPYGIRGEETSSHDPLADICRQVAFHRSQLADLEKEIGSDRLLILPYEDFCARPAWWVCKISEWALNQPISRIELEKVLAPFPSANKQKVDEEVFRQLRSKLSVAQNVPA